MIEACTSRSRINLPLEDVPKKLTAQKIKLMIYNAERGDISIAVGGDAMITRRMTSFNEPSFIDLIDILKSADVSVVNLEMLFHDYESSWQFTDTTYTRSDPNNLSDLKWMGVDAVTTANNHSFDFSEGGFLTTLRHCKEFDLPAVIGVGEALYQSLKSASIIELDATNRKIEIIG